MNPTYLVIFAFFISSCMKNSMIVSGLQSKDLEIFAPVLDYTGATGISANVGTPMSVSPTTFTQNGGAVTNCSVTPALPAGLSINNSTCVISGTPSSTLASTTYSVVATNSLGASSAASVTLTITSSNCPSNYAAVPANPSLGVTNGFCVAQFEMKNVASVATSQAAGGPWVSVNQTNAKTACTSLGTGYDLISNPEWLTIAYEIEKTASNWSSGVVGTGMLNRGHSDSSPNSALAVTDTNDPYTETGNNSGQAAGSGWEQKRTHTLSNGQVV
jgi:hypothetical protein